MLSTKGGILFKGFDIPNKDIDVAEVITDSRMATKNCVFVCIEGEHVDGHSYAKAAIDSGAVLIVAQHEIDLVPKDKCVIVNNTLDAMIAIGANYRDIYSPLVVGITGSVGKTTTKEFCYSVFSAFGNTLKTTGNQNNEIGLPNTLFRMNSETQYAVLEMGMQGLGEIQKLTMAAKPRGAIITGIGYSHLLQLKTRENILKAKLEICEGLVNEKVLVTPYEDEFLQNAKLSSEIHRFTFGENEKADVFATDIVQEGETTFFTINDKIFGSFSTNIPALGLHNVKDALSAYTLATRLGMNAKIAAEALSLFETTGHRQKIVKHGGATVIEDCYNANPDSMRAALQTLKGFNASRKIAVLGDMFELGDIQEKAHCQIGNCVAECGVDLLITVGSAAKLICDTAIQRGVTAIHCKDNLCAAKKLKEIYKPLDIILVKASHGMRFEEILQQFYKMID